MQDQQHLRFPIGLFEKPDPIQAMHINIWTEQIESFPKRLAQALEGLNEEQLQWRYRSGGWSIQQVVHHCADSHMNSFIRFKLALTEEHPTIKAYIEQDWAELVDTTSAPTALSLQLLQGLHARWAILLRSLSAAELQKTFVHPEHGRVFRLDENIGIYAWHGEHHLAHVHLAKEQQIV